MRSAGALSLRAHGRNDTNNKAVSVAFALFAVLRVLHFLPFFWRWASTASIISCGNTWVGLRTGTR